MSKELLLAIEKVQGFEINKSYEGMDGRNAIAADLKAGLIAIAERTTAGIKVRVLPGNKVISAEIIQGEEDTTAASTGSMVGRAIVGGVLTGGIGALAGAVTAKRNKQTSVSRLALELTIEDVENPVVQIVIWDGLGLKKGGAFQSAFAEQAKEWQGLLKVVQRKSQGKGEGLEVQSQIIPYREVAHKPGVLLAMTMWSFALILIAASLPLFSGKDSVPATTSLLFGLLLLPPVRSKFQGLGLRMGFLAYTLFFLTWFFSFGFIKEKDLTNSTNSIRSPKASSSSSTRQPASR